MAGADKEIELDWYFKQFTQLGAEIKDVVFDRKNYLVRGKGLQDERIGISVKSENPLILRVRVEGR